MERVEQSRLKTISSLQSEINQLKASNQIKFDEKLINYYSIKLIDATFR